jgi:hypothetical protein
MIGRHWWIRYHQGQETECKELHFTEDRPVQSKRRSGPLGTHFSKMPTLAMKPWRWDSRMRGAVRSCSDIQSSSMTMQRTPKPPQYQGAGFDWWKTCLFFVHSGRPYNPDTTPRVLSSPTRGTWQVDVERLFFQALNRSYYSGSIIANAIRIIFPGSSAGSLVDGSVR